MIGSKFNKLLVVKYLYSDKKGKNWLCICDCGNEKIASTRDLNHGYKTSCGLGFCSRKKTHDKFIYDLNKLDYEYEIVGRYEGAYKKILVRTKYGLCLSTPINLLSGMKPDIKSAINKTEYFINMILEKYPISKYNYSKFIYIHNAKSTTIICPVHGEFQQSPNSHISGHGCKKCSNKIKRNHSNTEEFIKKARKIHGDRFNYNLTIYNKAIEKVKIICKIHGEFKQTPNSHLIGSGCIKCGYDNNKGTTLDSFILNSKSNISTLYIINCKNENEEFYKIGITNEELNKRFNKYSLPYNYKIINIYKNNPNYIWNLELELLIKYNNFKYIPSIKFGGYTECFNLDLPIKEISDILYHVMESDGFLTTAP